MTDNITKQTCPHCKQVSGVEIIYGSIDTLSEAVRNALNDGDVVIGGTSPKWDWEEELIDTRCLQCNHEWHREHKTLRRINLWREHNLIHTKATPAAEMQF